MNAEQKNRALWQCVATHQGQASDRFALKHARTLRRAQMTLRRWAELECGDGHCYIERDEKTGKPRMYRDSRYLAPNDPRCWSVVPDRERGALARVEKVCKEAGLYYYHQTDPRGCALYVGTEPLTASNYSTKGIPCL